MKNDVNKINNDESTTGRDQDVRVEIYSIIA